MRNIYFSAAHILSRKAETKHHEYLCLEYCDLTCGEQYAQIATDSLLRKERWVRRVFLILILTNEGHEAFIVGGLAELLHQGLRLFLGQLLSKVGQHFEQLVGQHGVVVVLVVQLQDLNEVVEASLVLGVLARLVHGEHVVLGSGSDQ